MSPGFFLEHREFLPIYWFMKDWGYLNSDLNINPHYALENQLKV